MKRLTKLFAIGIFSVIFGINASAYSFKSGNLCYNILSEADATAEVTYESSQEPTPSDESYINLPREISIPEKVSNAGKEYAVVAIGEQAFAYAHSVYHFIIPNSIMEVKRLAFQNLSNSKITILDGDTPIKIHKEGMTWTDVLYLGRNMDYCSKEYQSFNGGTLRNLTIGDRVTELPRAAFFGNKLEALTLGKGLKFIGENGFGHIVTLKRINIPKIDYWCRISFEAKSSNPLYNGENLYVDGKLRKNIVLPDTLTTIKQYAFGGSKASSFKLPESLKKIEQYAFEICDSMKEITIPQNVELIEQYAFNRCKKDFKLNIADGEKTIKISSTAIPTVTDVYMGRVMTNETNYNPIKYSQIKTVTLGNKITTLPYSYFYKATALETVNFSTSLTNLGESVFSACDKLKKVNVPDMGTWCRISFENEYANPLTYAHNLYINNVLQTELVLPDTLTAVKPYAFYGCNATAIKFPERLKSIGKYAFKDCNALTSLELPPKLENIDIEAFAQCTGIKSAITIPNQVKTIERQAFQGINPELEVIIADGNLPINICAQAFPGCKNYYIGRNLGEYKSPYNPFYRDYSVETVTLGDSVTAVPGSCFYDCGNLKSINLGKNIKTSGGSAFTSCPALTKVNISDLDSWCKIDFENESANPLFYAHNLYINNVLQTKLILPDTLTAVKPYVFSGCGVKDIQFPVNLKKIGAYAFSSCDSIPTLQLPESLEEISSYAFTRCKGFRSNINIPKNVTIIAEFAFEGIDPSVKITLADSEKPIEIQNYAFNSSRNFYIGRNLICKDRYWQPFKYSPVDSVTFGKQVTIIPNYCFAENKSLKTVNFTNGLGVIGETAFGGCDALTKVSVPDMDSWCKITFRNEMSNPLYYAKKLYVNGVHQKELALPDTLTEIKDYAFTNTDATSVIFPAQLKKIGRKAFHKSNTLKALAFPTSLENIGEAAFDSFQGTEPTLTIPINVKNIEIYAFKNLTAPTKLIIADSEKPITIADDAFDNISEVYLGRTISNNSFQYCLKLETVTLGDKFTQMSAKLFNNCSALKTVNLGKGLVKLLGHSFNGCSNLTKVNVPDLASWCNIHFPSSGSNPIYTTGSLYVNGTQITHLDIPEGVVDIHNYAFSGGSTFTSLTLPESLKTIGEEAFSECSGLTDIYVKSYLPPSMNSSWVFEEDIYSNANLHIPTTATSLYTNAAVWNRFLKVLEDPDLSGIAYLTNDGINVEIEGGNICVNGAEGQMIEVYQMNGLCIYQGKETTIPANAGLYIVRVAGKAFKVYIH